MLAVAICHSQLAAKDYDAAYDMLSSGRRGEMSRKQFEAQLPKELRSCTGISINGISGGVGTVVGSESCVDGYLDGVQGHFAFDLVSEADGALAIDRWREGSCRRP